MLLEEEIIYEGKTKYILKAKNPLTVIQYFKDDVTAFNKKKHEVIHGKGVINNFISAILMEKLREAEINTHFIKVLDERKQLVKNLRIIPIEVVVRNITAGSFCKRFSIKEGKRLKFPLIEFFHKNDVLCDPIVNEDYILDFGLVSRKEIEEIKIITFKINKILADIFSNARLNLVDLKLEFGKSIKNKKIILADEISPDNCRLWDNITSKKLDKDVFRLGLGNIREIYLEVMERLLLSMMY